MPHPFAFVNNQVEQLIRDPQWGEFIYPDNETYVTVTMKLPKLDFNPFIRQIPLLGEIIAKIDCHPNKVDFDRYPSSAKYYSDCFNLLQSHTNKIKRIIKVGTYLGNMPSLIAGCLESMHVTLDLVDIDKAHLQISHKRICDLFPQASTKVRLFFGDLPSYVKNVLSEDRITSIVHYNGSINFNEIVNDIATLNYVKDCVVGVMSQHINLRSTDINLYVYPDLAMFAIFGFNLLSIKLGQELLENTLPSSSDGIADYCVKERIEGLYIPFSHNEFRYPHPTCNKIEDFLIKYLEPIEIV